MAAALWTVQLSSKSTEAKRVTESKISLVSEQDMYKFSSPASSNGTQRNYSITSKTIKHSETVNTNTPAKRPEACKCSILNINVSVGLKKKKFRNDFIRMH